MTTIEQTRQTTELHVQALQQDIQSRIRFTRAGDYRIDQSEQEGRANCIGYTLLGSKALEEAGIEHDIIFAATHAACIRPIDSELVLTDFTAPNLDLPINDDLAFAASVTAKRRLAMLDTGNIIANSGKEWWRAVADHPWLEGRGGYINGEISYKIPTSIFTMADGRKAIYRQQLFTEAHYRKDYATAAKELVTLGELFPTRDINLPFHREVKNTIHQLAKAHNFDLAEAATEAIYSNFDFNLNYRVRMQHGDCLRYIAKQSGESSLALRAIELYRRARDNPRSNKRALEKKIKDCEKVIYNRSIAV